MDGQQWRAAKRVAIRERVERSEAFEKEVVDSPSGKYMLAVFELQAADSGWNYSMGVVSLKSGAKICVVERNYGAFPYSWAESHPNGHDYLICGEDYQGQTIVELDTGRRVDHLPQDAESGTGFCWAAHYVSSNRRYLAVDGCIWACPYELVIFDFTDPMALPYTELYRAPLWEVHDGGFLPDGSISWSSNVEVRTSDGKPLDDLDKHETEALLDENQHYRMELIGEISTRRIWRPDATVEIV
jgi:hypothetical protein